MLTTVNQLKTLREFAKDYVQELKTKAPKSSGNLSKSIESSVHSDEVVISMLNYGSIVDEGINGVDKKNGSRFSFTNKKPPIRELIPLAKSIGTSPFALQNSIYKNGYRGSHFISKTIDKNVNSLADNLAEAVWEDFSLTIDKNK